MKTIGTLLMIFFFGATLHAQGIVRSIGNTAKNKVQQQDFNTTRTNKDKNNIQNEKKESPASAPAQTEPTPPTPETDYSNMDSATAVNMANTSSKDLNYKESYTFDGKMTYEIEDLKKSSKNSISYHYGNGSMCTEMKDKNMCSIYDYENEVMIMFDEKSMSATIMSSAMSNKMIGQSADNHEEKVGGTTITKTGLTKKILGYNCDNYIATNGDGSKTDFWITTELVINNDKTIAAVTKNMMVKPSGDYPASGVMMEFTGYNKKSVAESHMIMTEFDTTPFTKALAGYRITKLAY